MRLEDLLCTPRAVLVDLVDPDEGRRRADETFRIDMALEAALISGLTENEQHQLERLSRKLVLTVPVEPG